MQINNLISSKQSKKYNSNLLMKETRKRSKERQTDEKSFFHYRNLEQNEIIKNWKETSAKMFRFLKRIFEQRKKL
jgi:hypothetical protein